MPLSVATGYAELALWLEAWEAIENAAEADRSTPAAMRLRLHCCTQLDLWAMGANVASLLTDGTEEDREAAARFYYQLARHEIAEGNSDFARAAIGKAIAAWPGIKIDLLDDPERDSLL